MGGRTRVYGEPPAGVIGSTIARTERDQRDGGTIGLK